jgi:hypothetical protein
MDDDLIEAVAQHVKAHIGEAETVLHELIPTSDLHIDMHVVKPTDARPFYTVVTSGMSELPMTIPTKHAGRVTPYAELMLALPATWRVDCLRDDRWGWPIAWLKFLAAYPHENHTWLGNRHTIPNGEDVEPFSPNTKLACWFVRSPKTVPGAFREMRFGRKTVDVLALTAIYRSELELAISEGLAALDAALTTAGVTELLDVNRPPVK